MGRAEPDRVEDIAILVQRCEFFAETDDTVDAAVLLDTAVEDERLIPRRVAKPNEHLKFPFALRVYSVSSLSPIVR